MRYIPSALTALAVGVAVSVALYITKEKDCLWGLVALYFAYLMLPCMTIVVDQEDDDIEKVGRG